MRALFLMLVATVAMAAPAKKKAPPKKPVVEACTELTACLAKVEAAFEEADFETAQRLVRQAEPLAKTSQEQARVLVLQGALDAQALGLTDEVKAQVLARFTQAQRLDEALTVMAIPAFARTEALEALWNDARPPPPAPVDAPKEAIVQVVPLPAVAPPARRFPVFAAVMGAVALAGGGAALGLERYAQGLNTRAIATPYEADAYPLWQNGNAFLTASAVTAAGAGTMALAAIIGFFVWLGTE